ncbi:sensor domain-containing diguanylate cyclase [Leptospira adleri]|uniref:diguanylate cyclase n=1 Tax=Leptospira adleri TaxID=2023186 RepID=A0A2M9YKC1_9LEPT|nr:sensor domain-containing diguanylate cyclase [Leptospira adleri]PJZ51988.1 diguanylate cyclase [Leptospira adleri]PJZ60779.1 diguanylate cyclase [Leptospira adleri]
MNFKREYNLEKFVNNSLDLISIQRLDGTVIQVNPSFERILGWSEKDLLGRNPFHLLHPDDLDSTLKEIEKLNQGIPTLAFQNRYRCFDGSYKFFAWTCYPDLKEGLLYTSGRDITDLVESNRKISQLAAKLKETNDKLFEQASTDPLTKLKNRRAFQEELQYLIRLALKEETPISLLMVDADHFKAFNDQFGHLEGDQVLVHLGNLLLRSTRESDIVARYGGEEFIIALPGASEKEAATIAESIARTIRDFSCEKKNVTVSIGISTIQFHSNRWNENTDFQKLLIENADQALYQSKINGRNRVTHHSSIDPKNLLSPRLDSDCSHTE